MVPRIRMEAVWILCRRELHEVRFLCRGLEVTDAIAITAMSSSVEGGLQSVRHTGGGCATAAARAPDRPLAPSLSLDYRSIGAQLVPISCLKKYLSEKPIYRKVLER